MKKALLVLLAVATLITAAVFGTQTTSAATTYKEGVLTYTVSDGAATITHCEKNASGDLVIPNTLGGYPVTSIYYEAFKNCFRLTSVEIPTGVTSIGFSAFNGCSSLKGVYITDIAAWCNINFIDYYSNPLFYAKKLYLNNELVTNLVIPEGVTSIRHEAFYNCSTLTSVVIPDSVTTMGDYAFYNCDSLTTVKIGNSVTSISNMAFGYCDNLTNVVIGDSVAKIGDSAFEECISLTNVVIPDSVTNISDKAFYKCGNLISLVIGDSVAKIGDSAFGECVSLTNVVIPDSVTNIGNSSFYYCRNLTSVIVPDSVITVGNSAFMRCSSLTSVVIGNSVTSIGISAFEGCSELVEVHIKNIATLCKIDFRNLYSNPLSYADKLYLNGELLTVFEIPDGVTSIGNYALRGCSSLTHIIIPDSVTSIGNYAFWYCSNLTSIVFGGGVTSIGKEMFEGCNGLTSVTIPKSIINVEKNAFYDCWDLEKVYYEGTETEWANIKIEEGNAILTAQDVVFNYLGQDKTFIYTKNEDNSANIYGLAKDLTNRVVIPVKFGDFTITSIGDGVFSDCKDLIKVGYMGTEEEWGKITIGQNNAPVLDADLQYNATLAEPGDVDGIEGVSSDDAIYLLYNVLFGASDYPLDQECDFDGNGVVDSDDAIHLLYHVLFGAINYPLR